MVSRWWLPLRPLALLVVVALLGTLFGLGGAASLGGILATFVLGAAFGGSLHSDVRVLVRLGAAVVLGVGAIALLHPRLPLAADLLVVAMVFVAGLMPVLGPRFVGVGVGLGMAAVYARGIGAGAQFTPAQAFGAPALAVAVVVGLRWAQGRSDPSGPVRAGLADALVDLSPVVGENAARLVEADRPRRWLDDAAKGLHAYRNAVVLLTSRVRLLDGPPGDELDQQLRTAAGEAQRVAVALRLAAPPDPPPAHVRRPDLGSAATGAADERVGALWRGLELVRTAATRRDPTIVDSVVLPVRHNILDTLRGALTWRSVQLRHAVRSVLGIAVALGVLQLVPLPFTTTFLVATYSTMQPTWSDSLRKARDRVAGTLLGAAALGISVGPLDLPQPALVASGVVALVVAYYFLQSRPVIGNAGLIFTTVGMTSSVRQLDPALATLQCIGVSLLAVGIGLVFGFVAVPGMRRPRPRERWDDAVRALRDLLDEVSEALRRDTVDRAALSRRFRAVATARTNLTAYQPGTVPREEQQDAAERAAETLREMSTAALALVVRPGSGSSPNRAVEEVARQLVAEPDPAAVVDLLPLDVDDEQRRLVETLISGSVSLHDVAGAPVSASRRTGPRGG